MKWWESLTPCVHGAAFCNNRRLCEKCAKNRAAEYAEHVRNCSRVGFCPACHRR